MAKSPGLGDILLGKRGASRTTAVAAIAFPVVIISDAEEILHPKDAASLRAAGSVEEFQNCTQVRGQVAFGFLVNFPKFCVYEEHGFGPIEGNAIDNNLKDSKWLQRRPK